MDRVGRRCSLAFVCFVLALLHVCSVFYNQANCLSVAAAVAAPSPVVNGEQSVRVHVMDQSGAGSWCIAKPSANEVYLQNNIDFACRQENVNCSVIQTAGSCLYPYNVVNHASVVMNLYYKTNNQQVSACFFAGTGLTVLQDPSSGDCLYA